MTVHDWKAWSFLPEKCGTSANDLLDLKPGSEGTLPVVRGWRGGRPGVPPARAPPGCPRGVVPRGVDPHGVVHLRVVAVVEPRGVVRVVHPRDVGPRGVGPRGVGRPRGGDSRGVVHPRDDGPLPAAAVCSTVAEVLRSLWFARGSVPGGSCGYCAGSGLLELWVAVLIADAGRGAVDGSWPVPPQQLMFLPATPPSRSPAVPPGAERWQSSRPVPRFLRFPSRFGIAVAARRRLNLSGSTADVL